MRSQTYATPHHDGYLTGTIELSRKNFLLKKNNYNVWERKTSWHRPENTNDFRNTPQLNMENLATLYAEMPDYQNMAEVPRNTWEAMIDSIDPLS